MLGLWPVARHQATIMASFQLTPGNPANVGHVAPYVPFLNSYI